MFKRPLKTRVAPSLRVEHIPRDKRDVREQGVQIIEVTDLAGVRAAVHTFGTSSTPLRFVVFPMVHLADRDFYEQVERRLQECDLVVAEGVTGRSLRSRTLTATYRWLKSSRLGLTQQGNFEGLGVPVVNPDVSASELGRTWRQRVPLLTSLAVWLLVPPLAVGMRLFGTRRFIAKNLGMDDLPAPKEVLVSDRVQGIIDVVVKHRDRPLLKELTSIHQERCHEPIQVAVTYGAGHAPAVITTLHALGYRHRHAEWLTVFTVDS